MSGTEQTLRCGINKLSRDHRGKILYCEVVLGGGFSQKVDNSLE